MDNLDNSKSISGLHSIVHDLKTPITSIMGFAELLKQGNYDEQTKNEFYDIIFSESEKLLNMVNNILYIQKEKDTTNLSDCNLNIQINKYVKELTPLAKKRNIDISIKSSENDIYVSIPEDKVSRILVNIIENAIKYNKDSGKVFIDISETQGKVYVKIRDTGVGIPSDEISKIFGKYYRTSVTKSSNIEGSGLGLAIANDIVSEYKGTIQVSSKLGEYTEFIITFPSSNI